MGIIDKILQGVEDAVSTAEPALEPEPDDPPETEQEKRRRIQDALLSLRESDGLCFRWRGRTRTSNVWSG